MSFPNPSFHLIPPGSTIGILGGGQLGRMLAIGKAGAVNAGLLAAAILALNDEKLASRLEKWRKKQTRSVAKRP